ncbi:TPA: hypothetical protein U2D36_000786 [Streptococcus suis]|nr:hypothetical protein [Streptococcus suis]HEM6356404.1 hypothetical protein [Streptococcus suis]HEM6380538.1 hypothetical protein [Streptococcus suis]HEM6409758.1 hypothetical protein [Streptococcus suis]
MRTIKKIKKDQVDYTILQLMLDALKMNHQIDEQIWDAASKALKDDFNPPTRMLEDYNEKNC